MWVRSAEERSGTPRKSIEEQVRLACALAFNRKKDELDIESAIDLILQEYKEKVAKREKEPYVETVELHIKLATDPKRSDQIVRGVASLPHGTGKKSRIAVFTTELDMEKASTAGADIVGGEELIQSIKEKKGSNIDFDFAIATPGMMPKLASIARILGPRGLMPNPKVGTVTDDVVQAVSEFRKGRIDFRADKGAAIHAGLGKADFESTALVNNVVALFGAVILARPKGVKGSGISGYIKSISMCTTQGQSIRVNAHSLLNLWTKRKK